VSYSQVRITRGEKMGSGTPVSSLLLAERRKREDSPVNRWGFRHQLFIPDCRRNSQMPLVKEIPILKNEWRVKTEECVLKSSD